MHRTIRRSFAVTVACFSCAISHAQSSESTPAQKSNELPFDGNSVIANLVALPPDKPVKLRLGLGNGAQSNVRELVALIDHYRIARMTVNGIHETLMPNAPYPYQNLLFELEFTAAGPSLHSQLDRAECIIAARFQESGKNIFRASYIDQSGFWRLVTTIQLTSNEAARLVKNLPAPITRVGLASDDELESVDMIEKATREKIEEKVLIRYNAKIPPGCEKYIALVAPP
jgi:hypothetical protein